jgi:hypothetical protein
VHQFLGEVVEAALEGVVVVHDLMTIHQRGTVKINIRREVNGTEAWLVALSAHRGCINDQGGVEHQPPWRDLCRRRTPAALA